jgi:HD-GYP domain-containing protein (c-di-GMP phosphodiesterase class II)
MGDAGLTQAGHVITGERERGESIAAVAQTVAVAETYDRGGPDPAQAAESLRRAAQTHLDPQLVEVFLESVAPLAAGGLADRRGGRFSRHSTSPAQAPPPS